MLKFIKSAPYIPDPEPSQAVIDPADSARAREQPPHVVPAHCKPWLDGQKIGWTLSYGYISPIQISLDPEGGIQVQGLEQLIRETGQPRVVDRFSDRHFGLGSGYTLITPPGFQTLLLPTEQSPGSLRAMTGLIESDWYPRQLFLVFDMPTAGQIIRLDHGDALARAVVVPAASELQAEPASARDIETIKAAEARYLADEESGRWSWTAASGDQFTHVYKEWSKQHRHQSKDN
jgi:hypothetical protein